MLAGLKKRNREGLVRQVAGVPGSRHEGLQPSERFQAPLSVVIILAEDVQVAIVSAHFVELVVRPIPLVDDFFDHVVAISHPEPDGPLIRLSAGIALDLESHSVLIITG